MGLSSKEKISRAKETAGIATYNLKDEKKYVFISYKSDDWKTVLNEIVRNMQAKYGLRVYFDKNFEYDNKIWNKNMKEAIETSHCVAMLAFVSREYMKSPACLMEILRARTVETENQHEGNRLEIIPIVIDECAEIKELQSKRSGQNIPINKDDMIFYDIVEEAKKSSYMKERENLLNMLGPLGKAEKEITEGYYSQPILFNVNASIIT